MPPSGAPDLVGQTLAGRYVVDRKLGAGGMGAVYAARDLNLNDKLVAIKIPRPDLMNDPAIRERWDDEIGKLIDIEPHPHIVKVQDRGRHDGVPYIVMEYQSGGDLKDKLDAAGGRMSVDGILEWLPAAAGALDHLHTVGIIHRDVKPGNFVFDRRGNVFVTDFGIAKALEGPALTRTGVLPGTTLYMGPEAVKGVWTPAYDQYALATTVYECLSGRFPFMADDPNVLLTMKVTQKPKPLGEVLPNLPVGVSECLMKALEREPERRFKNCVQFANEFRRCAKPRREVRVWLKWVALGSGAIAFVLAVLYAFRGLPPARVTINSDPPARIAFNGKEGSTPFEDKRVPRGQKYQLSISRPGFVTREETVSPSKWRPGGVALAYTLVPQCADASPGGSDEALRVGFADVELETETAILNGARFVRAVGPKCASDASVVAGTAGLTVNDASGTALAPPTMTSSADKMSAIKGQLEALLLRKMFDSPDGGDDSVELRVSAMQAGAGGAEPVAVSAVRRNETVHVYLKSTEARYILAFTLDASGLIGLLHPVFGATESKIAPAWLKVGGTEIFADAPGQCAFYVWSSTRPWAPFLDGAKAGELSMVPGAPPLWNADTIPPARTFASALIGSLPPKGQWARNRQVVRVE